MHSHCSVSLVRLLETPWTVTSARLLGPWGFSGKNTGVGCHFPPPGDLPDPGIKLASPALQAGCLPADPSGKPLSLVQLLFDIGSFLSIFVAGTYQIRGGDGGVWMETNRMSP